MFGIPGVTGATKTARSWLITDHTDTAATFSRVAVTEDEQGPGWSVAGGYYLHLAGRNLLSTAPTITSAHMGAFVDGDELRPVEPPDLPTTGTARYEGLGAGVYVTQYGTGFVATPGSTEIGEFEGITTLTANFTDNTISGCFGCKGGILQSGVTTNSVTGAQTAFDNQRNDTRIHLGAAQINSDGTFRVNYITIFSPTAQRLGLRITEQGGSWGGKFSKLPAPAFDDHSPRLAAGTFGGRYTLHNGNRASYIGAFAAGKQQ